MGIDNHLFEAIASDIKGASILCLGFPDIVANNLPYKPTKFRDRDERHGGGKMPDTHEFFEILGAKSVRYIDMAVFEGSEDVIDLNYPHELGEYDLVIDPGTLEHCFNIGVAFINAASCVKVGGAIAHSNPMNMVNHGFYNLNPGTYHDFYGQNGFSVDVRFLSNGTMFKLTNNVGRIVPAHPTNLYVKARRKENRAITFPTQSKYL